MVYRVPLTQENIKKYAQLLAPKYKKLNWQWSGYGIPEESNIEESFKTLATHLESMSKDITTGGLVIERSSGQLFLNIHEKLQNSISKEEFEEAFKKRSKRMLRLV